jgi:CheY-like chemotaxis protein
MTDNRSPHAPAAGTQSAPVPGDAAPVVALAEMLFASRIRAAGEALGVPVAGSVRATHFLEVARRRRPRLLIVDLELRGQDVPGLIRTVKADPDLASIPLVAFSSHLNTEAIAAGRAAGADRVLARSAFVASLPRLMTES